MQNTNSESTLQQIKEEMKPKYLKAAKYDFALIKLSRNIKRDDYFRLFQNLNNLSSVTVCGFSDS